MTTPSHGDILRDIGGLEAGLEALKDAVEKGFSDTGTRLEKVETRLASLEAKENQRKGALAVIVSVAGTIGAAVWAVIEHLWK